MIAPQDVWTRPELVEGREGVGAGCEAGYGTGVGIGSWVAGVNISSVGVSSCSELSESESEPPSPPNIADRSSPEPPPEIGLSPL